MHPSPALRLSAFRLFVLGLFTLLTLPAFGQSTGGRIVGRVADPTGAVLAGVKITLTNDATGASRDTQTNASGDYNFVEVVPGSYRVEYELAGFKKNVQTGVIVDVNQVVTLNSILQVGATQEVVEVTSEAPQVDTTSTQLGAVINNRSVNELPLNTRDTYQFLQLQPGVQAQLGNGNGSLFYGSQDTGSVSVNGGRTRANNFSVNGGDANDQFVNLPTVQPSPDSVEEFRVITNTFDAEYGRNSGSVVNVITKSGTNNFHGDIFEYFRNTVLDAQGYFNTTRPQWNQNQFGGTIGGPIKKDSSFFFVSYEGRRIREGTPGPVLNVPTTAQRGGDFSGVGGFANGGAISSPFVATVLDGRSSRGTTCPSAISALGGTAPAAGVAWSSIFPTGVIPTACQDPVAANLMQQFVPVANVGTGLNQSVPVSTDNGDQFTVRYDQKISSRQNFSAYYYFNDLRQFQPYNEFEAAGADVPGFGNLNNNRFQQYNLSHTWTISNAVVNEARFTYMRQGQLGFLQPQSNNAVTASCTGAAAAFCFTGTSDSPPINNLLSNFGIPAGKGGITPGLPANLTGVPYVNISGGSSFGNNFEGFLPQVGNSFQWSDNLTWVKGNHTFKFGVDIRRARFDQYYYFDVNGEFTFNNSGSNAILPGDGDNYAEFLLGLADTYTQGSGQREDVRATAVYPFVQDSWKIKPNLTLNYGLRWELNTPLTDISGHVETFRPGQTSTVHPCQLSPLSETYFGVGSSSCANVGVTPTGLVVPGDKGIPPGMTSTYYNAFAPRIGLAYSPNSSGGLKGKIFGNNGATSIRAGFGLFYNPIEELVLAQFGAEPPFGGSSSLFDTFFNTPFVYQAEGTPPAPNPFNGILTPGPGQPVDYSLFRPLLLYGEFQPHLRTQYTSQYNLTIQRQLSRDMMLQLGYVGSEGHRLLASHDINPSNPQTCLDIMNIAAANPNNVTSFGSQATCGPFLEDTQWSVTVPAGMPFHMPNGSVVNGTGQTLNLVGLRPYSSPNCNPTLPAFTAGTGCPLDGVPVFSDIFAEDTIANSSYNAFEAMLEKRFSHGLQFQASYTLSKSLDDGSTFEETLDPFNFRASRGLSLFNSHQRFVVSYDWQLPIPQHKGFAGMLLNDWAVSGITQFQSGFPIRLDTEDDTELIASIFFLGTEAPSLVAPFHKLNPRNTLTVPSLGISSPNYYFNPGDFATAATNPNNAPVPPLGQFNNGTPRSICCGPGLDDWDFSVHKKLALTEARYFEFRAEIFNVFNHTNFYNPDGHFSDGPTLFGKITQAQDPRLVQFALKFYF